MPEQLKHLQAFYAENPARFIIDWGMTFDPRVGARSSLQRPVPAPFPKQEEWIAWFLGAGRSRSRVSPKKTRDMGMSWLTVALADTVCLFREA